jgi:hypothetical protein
LRIRSAINTTTTRLLKPTSQSLHLASLGKKDFGGVSGTLIHNGVVVSCKERVSFGGYSNDE